MHSRDLFEIISNKLITHEGIATVEAVTFTSLVLTTVDGQKFRITITKELPKQPS